MNKFKRISALVGAFLLLSLYVITFLSSFTASKHSNALFLACIYSSIIIPIFIYAITLVANVLRKKNEVEALKLQMKEKENKQIENTQNESNVNSKKNSN